MSLLAKLRVRAQRWLLTPRPGAAYLFNLPLDDFLSENDLFICEVCDHVFEEYERSWGDVDTGVSLCAECDTGETWEDIQGLACPSMWYRSHGHE